MEGDETNPKCVFILCSPRSLDSQPCSFFFLKKKTALQPKDADVTVKNRNSELFFLNMLINSVFLRHQPHGDPPV